MASNNAFSLQGATPFQPTVYGPTLPGQSAKSRALNALQFGTQPSTQSQTSTPAYNSGGTDFFGSLIQTGKNILTKNNIGDWPADVRMPVIESSPGLSTTTPPKTSPGLIAPTTQPVKSHTITNVDGSTVSQTYHPPVTDQPKTTAQDTRPGMGAVSNPNNGQGVTPPNPLSQSVTGLLNNQGNPNNQTASGAAESLVNSGNANTALGNKAQDIASTAGKRISEIGGQGARGEAGYRTTGTSPVAEGNSAIIEQTTAAQQQAISEGAQQELKGVEDALAAQGQTQSGQNQGGTLALTGSGQNISALNSAGNLSQPVSQFGVLGTPGSVGAFGSNTGSAAFQGGYIGGQQAAGQTAASMNVANTAAKGIQGTIQQYISANPQLNQSTSTIANAAQQWLQGKQLGDPAYQTLFNYLNEYISTLAPILGVGGDTTNLKTEIAQSFINAKASGQSISQVLSSIGTLADQKLQNIISAGQGGGQVAGGTPRGSTPTSFSTEW